MNNEDQDERNSTSCVKVRWLVAGAVLPDATAARIWDGLLPMLLVPRVRVRAREEKKLSSIELFMLRSVVKHKQLNLEDIENATGVPSGPLRVLLNGLVLQGLLENAEGGYAARQETAERAVETGTCHKEVETTMNFVYLPSTGDLLDNLSDGEFWKLSRMTARHSGPVPREHMGLSVKEIFQKAAERSGQEINIIDVEEPLVMPEVCPAFAFKGDLKQLDTNQLWVSFPGAGETASDDGQFFNFSFALGLIAELLRLSQQCPLEDCVRHATRNYLPQGGSLKNLIIFEPTSPSRISMTMPMDVIDRIYPRRPFTNRASMIVYWETIDAVVALENSVCFRPADSKEAAFFARDQVVQRICADESDPNNSLAKWIKEACEEFGAEECEVTKPNILNRLWQLKRFDRAYSLQAEGVFAYDQAS